MVSSRQDLLREVASLVGRARMADDPQKAADLIKQAADKLEMVASTSGLFRTLAETALRPSL